MSPFLPALTREVARHLDRELRLMEPIVGELTDCNAEALVISANNWLFPGSGSARLAYDHGGQETQAAINERRPTTEPLARGTTVTQGYRTIT